MCVDAYLKNYLLKIMEMYSVSKHHLDVWHDGRLADQTAQMCGYPYPKEAEEYAGALLRDAFL